ncbi:MAG: hypothetical protein WDN69_05825 [Aliidongia sp.]
MQAVLTEAGIAAPLMVVKGRRLAHGSRDGAGMSGRDRAVPARRPAWSARAS